MTIRSYKDESGRELFRVKAKKKSRANLSIVVQKQRRGIATLKEAKKIEALLMEEAQREVFERETAGESLRSIVDGWYMAQATGQGMDRPVTQITASDNSRALEIYCSHLMKLRARDITRMHVREIIERMDIEGKSNSRKRHVKGCLHGAIMWGIETGRIKGITQSPCIGIKISRYEEKKPEILTIAEIRKLMQAAYELDHQWKYIWGGALQTGARSGELYALEWTDVDFDNRRLTISKSWNGRLKQYKSTKSGYWREVPINTELERILKLLRAGAGDRKWVYPRMVDWQRGESARVLRAFCQGIGIPSVRFHALRACFATQLLRDSVAPAVVMKICGWADLKTMQRYIRLAGIEIEGATDSLKILPPEQVMGRVVELFGAGNAPS